MCVFYEMSLCRLLVNEGLQSLSVTWEAAVLSVSLVSQWDELRSTQMWSQAT